MAYVPPNKRKPKSSDAELVPPSPSPPPKSVMPRFRSHLNLKLKGYTNTIIYAENAIHKWFVIGLAEESRVSNFTRLGPVAVDSFEGKSGQKPLAQVLLKENTDEDGVFSENPWTCMVEKVKQDLLLSFEHVKDVLKGYELQQIKSSLVVRIGKVLFHGNRLMNSESLEISFLPLCSLVEFRKNFYTNVSPSYMEHVTSNAIPKTFFEFVEEKELYHILMTDNMQPDSVIDCKCTIGKETKLLELFKICLVFIRN